MDVCGFLGAQHVAQELPGGGRVLSSGLYGFDGGVLGGDAQVSFGEVLLDLA